MVAVAFCFTFGRYHATTWGTNVNEAAVDWPPSPWRILRALLAAARDAGETGIDEVLELLVAAGDPVYELPPAAAGHTRHYVPLTALEKGGPPKTSLIIDAFMALDPEQELRVFWDAELDAAARDALEVAARRLAYLGRSESLCTARLLPADARPGVLGAWPESMGAEDLPVADATTTLMAVEASASAPVSVLESDVGVLRKANRLIPEGTRQVRYATARPPGRNRAAPASGRSPSTVVLRIAGNALPELVRGVGLTAGLRRAAQKRFDHDRSGRTSGVLSGHVDDRPSDRQHALASIPSLRLRGMPDALQLALVSAGSAQQALPGFAGTSEVWETVTPMVLPRHVKPGRARDEPEAQVLAELEHRGFPTPETIDEIESAWGRFARDRPGQSQHRTKTAVGFRLRFAEPVVGPIVLGANSHFGLGLMRRVR